MNSAYFEAIDISKHIQSIDRSPAAIQVAHDSITTLLSNANYLKDINVTCGLQRVQHLGKVTWICKDDNVMREFLLVHNPQNCTSALDISMVLEKNNVKVSCVLLLSCSFVVSMRLL